MSRLMSVAFTELAVVERRKTVTRRAGWWEDKHGRRLLHIGDRLTLCRKVMGRKKGEPLVRLAEVEVVDVRREELARVIHPGELGAEGFPEWDNTISGACEFIETYFVPQGIDHADDVTRIEWRYLDQVHQLPTGKWEAECDHGSELWYLQRQTEHLARRSLDAHLRHEHDIIRRPRVA